jgi:hypothetical protein
MDLMKQKEWLESAMAPKKLDLPQTRDQVWFAQQVIQVVSSKMD